MKKSFWVVGMLFILLFASSTSAEEMLITLQSNSPATLPTVSEVVNIPDPTDLLNISYQATLFAFSSAGWNLAAQGTSSKIALLSPAVGWTGDCYYIDMKANLSNYSQLENLLGYDLNSGAKTYGPDYLLYFHDGTLTARSPHEIGPSTYGVISGGEGGYYYQCPVPDWGTFTAAAVPLPPSLFLLGPGMLGLLGIRVGRRIKGQPLTI